MANDSDQERTEEATPKRRQEARDKGQTARSRELSAAVILLVTALFTLVYGPIMANDLLKILHHSFTFSPDDLTNEYFLWQQFQELVIAAVLMLLPLLVLLFVIALAAPLALGGWVFKPKMQWEVLNPIKGLQRLFGLKALVELLKSFLKFVLVGGTAILVIYFDAPHYLALSRQPWEVAIALGGYLLVWDLLWLAFPLALIAAVDVPWQIFDFNRNLKMSRQEVRDEYKEIEGKPEVKQRIRRLQQEASRKRMMDNVPKADVVVVNPEHFAVALRYNSAKDEAPILVAKGVDEVAFRIRELATKHRIPTIRAPLLARALYFNGKLDTPIPVNLYKAVALVIGYLFELRKHGAKVAKNELDIPIPPDIRTE